MGLASSGVISWSDYISANPEKLKQIVDDFDLDPLLVKLKSERETLGIELDGLKDQLDKGTSSGWRRALAGEDYIKGLESSIEQKTLTLESVKKQIADILGRGQLEKDLIGFDVMSPSQMSAMRGLDAALDEINKKAASANRNVVDLKDELLGFDVMSPEQMTAMLGLEQIGKRMEDELDATKQYFDFAGEYRLATMEEGSGEYISLATDIEMKRWEAVKGITEEQLFAIRGMIMDQQIDAMDAPKDAMDDFSKGITENFTQSVQSELSNVFTDTLRGDLDSFEDYFQAFTNSLQSMWGSMAAKMTMESLTGAASYGAAGWAGLGVAGVALAGVGKILGDRAEDKAYEAQMKALRKRDTPSTSSTTGSRS